MADNRLTVSTLPRSPGSGCPLAPCMYNREEEKVSNNLETHCQGPSLEVGSRVEGWEGVCMGRITGVYMGRNTGGGRVCLHGEDLRTKNWGGS